MTPEERAEKREAVLQGMVAKGHTRDRAEQLFDHMAEGLLDPGDRFAPPEVTAPVTLTADERANHGRAAMDFPPRQLVYSLTDVEMIVKARVAEASS